MRQWWIRIIQLALASLLLGLAIYFLGPRMPVDTVIRFNSAEIGDNPEAYLKTSESSFTDIVPGTEKQIVWANPATKDKTPYAIVYIHGFSASAGEIRPVPDDVAKRLGANLYFARLQGHGRTNLDAMGDASLNGWLNDYAEAIAIGKKLGEKIIVISTSTGGAITSWGLTLPALSGEVTAAIFISPNFGIRTPGAFLLTGPWARQLAHLIVGRRTGFTPENAMQARFWTTSYPSDALLPMAQSVKLAVNSPVEQIKTPALFILSSADDVVRPQETKKIMARWGAATDMIDVGKIGTGSNHVIAGDALSPQMTIPVENDILGWLQKTLP